LDQLDTEGTYAYLFLNPRTGKPYVSVHKIWHKLRQEAGLPHLRNHDLRHQYASFLVNEGYSQYTVQQALGHSDPKVTQRSSHMSTHLGQRLGAGGAR
jgi:integrase